MTFTEAHNVYEVLSFFDSSWDVLETSLESMQGQDFTMTYLTGQLLEEEAKQLERAPGKEGESTQHRPASTKFQHVTISKGTPLREGETSTTLNNPQAFSGLQQVMQLWVSLPDGQRAAVKEEGNVYIAEISDIERTVWERVLGGIAQREKLWQQSWRLCKAQLKPQDSMSTHLQNMRRTFLELEKEE
ncbi:hypothetical protein E2320_000207 [Naja naja]|nr:hypothetical protein E2320_000207 [Naja naja]